MQPDRWDEACIQGTAKAFGTDPGRLLRPDGDPIAFKARDYAAYMLRGQTARSRPISWTHIAELLGYQDAGAVQEASAAVERDRDAARLLPIVAASIVPELGSWIGPRT